MKIAIADNCGLKFAQDIKDHWEAKGHEVRYERGASEYLAQWADIYYVEWIDGNLDYLWKIYNGAEGVSRTANWNNDKKPKIVCRMFDWDIWVEHVPFYSQQYIDFVDVGICIAPHIQKRILDKAPQWKDKLHLIRPGVNLDKFTLKTEETDGFQLGMVLGDMWWPKNHMGGLDIFTSLYKSDPRWRLHIRGQHEGGQYWPFMYEHYLDSRGIRDAVTLYGNVPDMNAWYEKIDTLLHPGMKETFCYAVGEAMAKGIPAVVNEFYGARDIWDKKILYNTHAEAIEKLSKLAEFRGVRKEQGEWAREYIEKEHNAKDMLKSYDKLLGL